MIGRPLALIAGLGEGLGADLATTFAAAGYDIAGLSRSQRTAPAVESGGARAGWKLLPSYRGPRAGGRGRRCRPAPLRIAVPPLVHNAQTLLIKPLGSETTLEGVRGDLADRLLRGEVGGAHVLPAIDSRGSGTLIFSGATARCVPLALHFAAFASAKFALRALAQSLSRECQAPRASMSRMWCSTA